MKFMKFEIYNYSGDGWRWRLKAANGKVIASGESYASKADCVACVALIQKNAANTPITYFKDTGE